MQDNHTTSTVPAAAQIPAQTLDPKVNPAEGAPTGPSLAERKRIPMSIPVRRLECPDIPGSHLHWFVEGNIPRAIQGGYERVLSSEVPLNQKGIGSSSTLSGNSALGDGVEIQHGIGQDGRPVKMVLMKIREEWWREDQQVLTDRNLNVMQAIFKKQAIAGSDDAQAGNATDKSQRYVKTATITQPILNRGLRKQS